MRTHLQSPLIAVLTVAIFAVAGRADVLNEDAERDRQKRQLQERGELQHEQKQHDKQVFAKLGFPFLRWAVAETDRQYAEIEKIAPKGTRHYMDALSERNPGVLNRYEFRAPEGQPQPTREEIEAVVRAAAEYRYIRPGSPTPEEPDPPTFVVNDEAREYVTHQMAQQARASQSDRPEAEAMDDKTLNREAKRRIRWLRKRGGDKRSIKTREYLTAHPHLKQDDLDEVITFAGENGWLHRTDVLGIGIGDAYIEPPDQGDPVKLTPAGATAFKGFGQWFLTVTNHQLIGRVVGGLILAALLGLFGLLMAYAKGCFETKQSPPEPAQSSAPAATAPAPFLPSAIAATAPTVQSPPQRATTAPVGAALPPTTAIKPATMP